MLTTNLLTTNMLTASLLTVLLVSPLVMAQEERLLQGLEEQQEKAIQYKSAGEAFSCHLSDDEIYHLC